MHTTHLQVNFSQGYWTLWVAIAFLWGHAAAAVTVLLPLWEGRAQIRTALGFPAAAITQTGGSGAVERLQGACQMFQAWQQPKVASLHPDKVGSDSCAGVV